MHSRATVTFPTGPALGKIVARVTGNRPRARPPKARGEVLLGSRGRAETPEKRPESSFRNHFIKLASRVRIGGLFDPSRARGTSEMERIGYDEMERERMKAREH
ncbi:di-/tricarboxylate transporter [Anopheles sinensis]|uniref:Di-/tricarboxylate transporter n=1 Tax=Anopheles sinensis TaxID=74873 RepID=A0A084WNQ0_ANOSI|nr:di-/tricarboxylate transporter [Anopheles sinensis]